MSRIAIKPIAVPKGVEVTLADNSITIKGPKGLLKEPIHTLISVTKGDDGIKVTTNPNASPEGSERQLASAMLGTMAALIKNMVEGVTEGFERRLSLVGVGYRAQAQGKKVNLSLGYSHPVVYDLPEGVTAETPEPTKIILKGVSKHLVGQVAANIRAKRPVEPYKGKGVRYEDESVKLKETKKK